MVSAVPIGKGFVSDGGVAAAGVERPEEAERHARRVRRQVSAAGG